MPDDDLPQCPQGIPWRQQSFAVANLEGAILSQQPRTQQGMTLFNSEHIVDLLQQFHIKAVSLANNHIFDAGEDLVTTLSVLKDCHVQPFGLQHMPYIETVVDRRNVVLAAFGWDVIGCLTKNKGFSVSPLEFEYIKPLLEKIKIERPQHKLILFMHWNYELELYPQPAHRELARACIDLGADLIVGCHSHCVQGLERYKGKYIVYGLGNWFMPSDKFWEGEHTYPERVNLQLAFDWSPETEQALCHWFRYDSSQNSLIYCATEEPECSQTISELTPYSKMSANEYKIWFVQNRMKKRLLPVFYWEDSLIKVFFKKTWIKIRHFLISILVSAKIKRTRA